MKYELGISSTSLDISTFFTFDVRGISTGFVLFLLDIAGVKGYMQMFFSSTLEFFSEFGIVEVKKSLEGLSLWPSPELESDFLRLILTEFLNSAPSLDMRSTLEGEQYCIFMGGRSYS